MTQLTHNVAQKQQQQQQTQPQQQQQQQLTSTQGTNGSNASGVNTNSAASNNISNNNPNSYAQPVVGAPPSAQPIYNQPMHAANIYMPAHGVHQPVGGAAAAVYSTMIPASNVFVNNVTANVNLHGWPHTVPAYIPGGTPQFIHGEIPPDQNGTIMQPMSTIQPIALTPANAITGPSSSSSTTGSAGRGSRRGRGRGGSSSTRRSDFNAQRHQPNEGSPVPPTQQQQQQQQQPQQSQEQLPQPISQTQQPSTQQQQIDAQVMGAVQPAYAPHPQYAYQYAAYPTAYYPPQNHMIHPAQAAAQQANGQPFYVPLYPGHQLYNYPGGVIYPQIINPGEYQYLPAEEVQGDERQNPEGMIPQIWHPQHIYPEEYALNAGDMHGGGGNDDINQNASSLATSETPSMLSPGYSIYDPQIHDMQQQMSVMQIYDEQQLGQLQGIHPVGTMPQLEDDMSDCGAPTGGIQMVPAGTMLAPIHLQGDSQIVHLHGHPQAAPPHHMITAPMMTIEAHQQVQHIAAEHVIVDNYGINNDVVTIQSSDSITNLSEINQQSCENIAQEYQQQSSGEVFIQQEQEIPQQKQLQQHHHHQQQQQTVTIVSNYSSHNVSSSSSNELVPELNEYQQNVAVIENVTTSVAKATTTVVESVQEQNELTPTAQQQSQQQPNQQQYQRQQPLQHQQQQRHQATQQQSQKPQTQVQTQSQAQPQNQQSAPYQTQHQQQEYQYHQQQQQPPNLHHQQQQQQTQHHHHQQESDQYESHDKQHSYQSQQQQHQQQHYQKHQRSYNNNSSHHDQQQQHRKQPHHYMQQQQRNYIPRFHNNNNNNNNSNNHSNNQQQSGPNNNNNSNDTSAQTTKSMSWTNSYQKKSTASVSVTATPIANNNNSSNKSQMNNYNHGSKGYSNQQHHYQQQQQQHYQHQNHHQQQPHYNNQQQSQMRHHGTMKTPSSPPVVNTGYERKQSQGEHQHQPHYQQHQQQQPQSQHHYPRSATTSTASTTAVPQQFPSQQQQQQSQNLHHSEYSSTSSYAGNRNIQHHQSNYYVNKKHMATTTTTTTTAPITGEPTPQPPAVVAPPMNLAPPLPPTTTSAASSSSNTWASLFNNKSGSSPSTNFTVTSATSATSSTTQPPSMAPYTAYAANNPKKPVAKVAPYEGISPVTPAPPLVTPGAMSYSAASAKGLTPTSPPNNTSSAIQTVGAVKPSKLEPTPVSRHLDEWTLKFAEFLSKHKTDLTPISLRPRGLTNRSNYCYINSILQALLGCAPFYNLIRSIPKQAAALCDVKTPTINAMLSYMSNFSSLPSGLRLNNRLNKAGPKGKDNQGGELQCDSAFEPTEIYKLWNESRDEHVEGRQEDAEEFLGYVLNKLNDEMLEVIKLIAKPSSDQNGQDPLSENEDGDVWQMICNNRNKGSVTRQTDFGHTPLSEIFRGELRSRLQREGEHSTDVIQPFFTLQLNIEKAASVKEALEILVGRDQLEGVTGSKSKQEVVAWQQMTLEKLPVILILHLKWFDYRSDGCTKILKTVEFPVELKIDPKILASKKYSQKQRIYRLFAVVYHDGKEASKGHYVTDVYHTGYSSWLRFDDSSVKPVSEHNVLHPHMPRVPYLLYYRRCDTLPQSLLTANNSNAATSMGNQGGQTAARDINK